MMITLLLALQVEITDEAVVWKDALRYQRLKPAGSKLASNSACYFHPFQSPKGVELTEVAPADHLHHRGIFLAWVEMIGKWHADYWGWGKPAPVDKRVIENIIAREEGGVVTLVNEWKAEGHVMLSEKTEVRLSMQEGIRILDIKTTLECEQSVVLQRWAFSGFALRAKKEGIRSVEGPSGPVTLKAPSHDKPETNWPDAAWYGFQYADAGVAVANRSGNPPTTWHVAKSIGLLNPAPQAVAPITILPSRTFSYRVLAWDGPTPRETLNTLTK